MRHPLALSLRYPKSVLTLLGVLTLWSLWHIQDLQLEVSARGMMVDNPEAQELYERSLRVFGSENATIVYIQDQNLFTSAKLHAIREALRRIDASPHVVRTVSLYSLRHLRTIDGYVYTNPYLKDIPETAAEIESIKQAALRNPLVVGNLLSGDARAMAINVYFQDDAHLRGRYEDKLEVIDEAIAPLHEIVDKAFHLGVHTVRQEITRHIWRDQVVILPLAVLVLISTLALAVRRVSAALIPLITAGLSIVWTLGGMAALQIPLNLMTAIVPALLIIIGSTEDIHLVAEYFAGTGSGLSRDRALARMSRKMGLAVTLTFITTYLGFLSVSVNDLELLRQFGLVSSSALLLNFLATVLLVPLLLRAFDRQGKSFEKVSPQIFAKAVAAFQVILQRHRRTFIAILLLVALFSTYGASRLQVNNNVMDYFHPDSELVANARLLNERLSGMSTLSVVVSGSEGTFLQIPYLEALQDIQDYALDMGYFDKAFSFADFVGVIHAGIDAEWDEPAYLPESKEIVAEYMSLMDQTAFRPFVSSDFGTARILIRHDIESSQVLNRAVDELRQYAATWLDPGIKLEITGESYLNSQAVDHMAAGQAQSLTLAFVVIFVVVSLLFIHVKAGLIAVAVNLFPIMVLFGVMGWTGLPIDTGTAMIGAITIGVCVDHTMHFLVRYQRVCQEQETESNALSITQRQEALPIVATALSLAAGFGILAASSFPPLSHFGLLSAMVMLLALVGTFVITPLILHQTPLVSVWHILSVRLRSDVIQKCILFKGLRRWQVRKLIALSDVRKYKQDEVLLEQDQETDGMLILLSGNAEVWHTRPDGSFYQVATLSPGMGYGESSLVSRRLGMADVVATRPTRALHLGWQGVARVTATFPRIGSKLYRNTAEIIASRSEPKEPEQARFHDQRSGTYSAAYFKTILDYLVECANRYDQPLALTSVTLQHDERHLHPDDLLPLHQMSPQVAAVIAKNVRNTDLFTRWNNHQYLCLMTNTDLSLAQRTVRRLRAEFDMVESARQLRFDFKVFELEDGETAAHFLARVESDASTAST